MIIFNSNPIVLMVIPSETLLITDIHFTIRIVTIIMKNSKYQTILYRE